jgi:BlaI family penicillinase repressor
MSREKRPGPVTEPSEGEWDLLEAVWSLEPTTARDVTEKLEEQRGWAYSTVKTLLDRMVAKGLLVTNKVGSVYQYSSAVARDDLARTSWKRLVERVFGGSNVPALQFVAANTKLTKVQRRALARLIEGEEEES